MQPKVAVITGAGRGIGKATAHELARRGFSLVLASRSYVQLQQVASDLPATTRVEVLECDVSNVTDVKRLFENTAAVFGRVDLLVNNAGVGHVVELQNTSDEQWYSTLNTNLTGTFFCCREAITLLEKSDVGLIINIASVAAVRCFAGFAAYSASKAGIVALSNSLREELRSRKIRVTVLLPGATDSPFWDNVAGQWDRSKMIMSDDVARAIADIAEQPANVTAEQLLLMPAGGAL